MRNISKVLFVAVFIIISLHSVVFANSDDIKILVDGKQLTMDVAPISKDGRTLIPLKLVLQALNAKVEWDEKTETITITKSDRKLLLKLYSTDAVLNGEQIKLDIPPISVNDRTMVPIRFISEKLGIYVEWNEELNAVDIFSTISYKKIKIKTGYYEGGVKDGNACRYGKVYSDSGVINTEGFFENGILNGYGKIYYNSGKLKYEGDFVNGIITGKGTSFVEETGKIEYKGDYKNNKADGYGWKYNKDGILNFEGFYKDGMLNGKGIEYYENGYIKYEGDYVNGIMQGYGKIFRSTGALIAEGQFENGQPNGICKGCDSYGVLHTYRYKNGNRLEKLD